MSESPHPPHVGVYVRLKVSRIHGIGVFAICPIADGINLFPGDASYLHEVERPVSEMLEPSLKKLYDDFCVIQHGKMYGPTNFNNITVGWYFNHSDNPNVECDANFNFLTKRAIKEGEELTVDYATYSNGPPSEHVRDSSDA